MSKRALVGNAADEEQVKDAGEKIARGRERELNDLRAVLSTVQGRRFVWRYLEACGISNSSFDQNPHRTYFLEGQRNIGLKLQADVAEAEPAAYLTMMKEAKGD